MAEESATDILETTVKFINMIFTGDCFRGARPYFFGARLIAINKKNGGVRPIAIGNILRRY